VLVTPSYLRGVFDTNHHEIWKASLEELRTADQWVIVGYSLPNEDFNIRSLFLKALHGRRQKLAITVIQESNRSEERYNHFFGKENYEFCTGGIEKFDFKTIT